MLFLSKVSFCIMPVSECFLKVSARYKIKKNIKNNRSTPGCRKCDKPGRIFSHSLAGVKCPKEINKKTKDTISKPRAILFFCLKLIITETGSNNNGNSPI